MSFRRRIPACGGRILTQEQGTKLKQFIYDAATECANKYPILFDKNNLSMKAGMSICWEQYNSKGQLFTHCEDKLIATDFMDLLKLRNKCHTETNEKIKQEACKDLARAIKTYQEELTKAYRYLKNRVPSDKAWNPRINVATHCARNDQGGNINSRLYPPKASPTELLGWPPIVKLPKTDPLWD